MDKVTFRPKYDKLFFGILIPTAVLMAACTVLAVLEPTALFVMIPTDLLVFYFLLSPAFGYVELRESAVFIRFGFILKREIPYSKIRGLSRERKFYADSMLSLKTALEHINIKYNRFDIVSVSVKDGDGLMRALDERISPAK